ncbi:MAG: hypothetical protein OEZ38_11605 [Gammaproteobacteria bacterium]|nr:hypothetical protein [Gammaproteobacteria bacterium]
MKLTVLLICLICTAPVYAEDKISTKHGETLHDEKCLNCHTSKVYTREDRTVKTLNALSNQVNNCMKGPAKAEWTEIETRSVIHYLNQKFYKF